MKKVVLLAAALVVMLAVTASSATSASSETGITARTITIGGTFPLTGRASVYAPIPAAMKAYFSYINSRKGPDGRRGINGRQIVFKYYDDAYNPANTVQQTRKLVEEDKVFAVIGSLGTEHNEAIRPYLNARKVPQLLNATGASTWSRDAKKYPWTGGWQPDYEYEGRIYGQAIGGWCGRRFPIATTRC
jgi:branched-chain amino acid transport system substrate-binding protein